MQLGRKLGCWGLTVLVLVLLFCVAAVIMLPGLHDFSIRLPNDYQLFRPYYQGNSIIDPHSAYVIGANVDAYGVVGKLVIGHVSSKHPPDEWHKEPAGYFILDTVTGKIQRGMTKQKWVIALRSRGITGMPRLRTPSIVGSWLSKCCGNDAIER